MKKIVALILLQIMCFCSFSKAQNNIRRIEIEDIYGKESMIIPIEEMGFIIIHEKGKRKKKVWQFLKYNSSFSNEWTKTINASDYTYQNHTKSDNNEYIYILFSSKSHHLIVTINTNNGDINKHIVNKYNKKTVFKDFFIVGNKAFLSGYVPPKRFMMSLQSWLKLGLMPIALPVFLISGSTLYKFQSEFVALDMSTGKVDNYNHDKKGHNFYIDNFYNKNSNTIDNVTLNKIRKNPSTLHINQFDTTGIKETEIIVTTKDKKELLDAKIHNLDHDKKIIIGSFRHARSGLNYPRLSTDNVIAPTDGVYFCKYSANNQEYIKYVNFADFDFYESRKNTNTLFMRGIERKIRRAKRKNKEIKQSLYRIMLHDVLTQKENYVIIGEIYYPKYREETKSELAQTTRAEGTSLSKYQTKTTRIFEGWLHDSGVLLTFNSNGDLIDHHLFDIQNKLSKKLKYELLVNKQNDDIKIMYFDNHNLHTKRYEKMQLIDEGILAKVKPEGEREVIMKSFGGNIDLWYENNILLWGNWVIKDKNKKFGNRKRKVFYFEKIVY